MFEDRRTSNESLIHRARSMLETLNMSKRRLAGVKMNGCRVVDPGASWKPPPQGWWKVNVDGAFEPALGGGCGGIIRNTHGDCIAGFVCRQLINSSINAEIWSILHGLKCAWDRGLRNILLETNSIEALKMVQDSNLEDNINEEVFIEIRSLLSRD